LYLLKKAVLIQSEIKFDNLRLTPKGRELGLVDDERWAAFKIKYEVAAQEKERLKTTWIQASDTQERCLHSYDIFQFLLTGV
jgi:tRNA U34 5-carboxymethylaminomethyl modifying enzyme MnmG/GidA